MSQVVDLSLYRYSNKSANWNIKVWNYLYFNWHEKIILKNKEMSDKTFLYEKKKIIPWKISHKVLAVMLYNL